MKAAIESTTETTEVDGVPCRVWMGVTESGIPILLFIHRIAVSEDDRQEEFVREFGSKPKPNEITPTLADIVSRITQ